MYDESFCKEINAWLQHIGQENVIVNSYIVRGNPLMFNTIGKLHVKLALYPSLKRLPVDRFLLNLLMPTFCM